MEGILANIIANSVGHIIAHSAHIGAY